MQDIVKYFNKYKSRLRIIWNVGCMLAGESGDMITSSQTRYFISKGEENTATLFKINKKKSLLGK